MTTAISILLKQGNEGGVEKKSNEMRDNDGNVYDGALHVSRSGEDFLAFFESEFPPDIRCRLIALRSTVCRNRGPPTICQAPVVLGRMPPQSDSDPDFEAPDPAASRSS